MSGSSGAGGAGTGFSFTAPALLYDGQNVGGSFNFDLPVVAATSANDAYSFAAGATDAAYSFLGQTDQATNSNNFALYTQQTHYLDVIGRMFASAADTAAENMPSNSGGGGLFGFLF